MSGPFYGGRAVSGPATPQFQQAYDPGGYLSPISWPPGGAVGHAKPGQLFGLGGHTNLTAVLVVVALLLLMEHFRPK